MRGAANLVGLIEAPVASDAEAWRMAEIRNACRAGFSSDTTAISPLRQRAWWAENRERCRAWLYFNADAFIRNRPLGFGLLRPEDADDGPLVTTVAVLPEFAGRGYGKAITRDLVERAGDRAVLATARLDNPAAVKLHDADYWIRVEGPDPRLAYFRALPPIARQSLLAWREAPVLA